MSNVPVAYMKLRCRDDGIAVLAIQVKEPVLDVAVSIFAHDSIDAAWRAGMNLTATENPLVWVAGLGPSAELPSLLEVGNVNSLGPTWGPLVPGPTRWVFLKPEPGQSEWIDGESAQAELTKMEQLREERFTDPLAAVGTSPDASEFLVLAIADNLHITQAQRVPGISLHPVTTTLGEDVRGVLNRILRERGIIWQWVSKKPWLAQMRSNRPAVLIECQVRADTPDAAVTFARGVIKQLLDMLTLRRGAAGNLIAGVITGQDKSSRRRLLSAWIEHSGYGENLVGGFIAGEDVHELQQTWNGLQSNLRAQLWVSLYADAVRDPRWDYQFFRCFNLLEAIADTAVQPNAPILDQAGNPRPFRNGNGNYTTRQAQGKIYTLLLQLAGTAADDQLWEEVGHWVRVRNDVAHEGTWQPPRAGETAEHAATHALIISLGHDATFESGTRPFVNRIRDSVKLALSASIRGTL